jgi:ABC-type branched-subunit amino acid transport system ATPase component
MSSLAEERMPLLVGEDIVSGYGRKTVLRGVTIDVQRGEIVALIGHNGAGKSTLLKSLFGLIALEAGRVLLDGHTIRPEPIEMLRSGITYLPQGPRVFTDFTVRENLEMGAVTLSKRTAIRDRLDQVIEAFSPLSSRLDQRAGSLSGGHKQLLALATALMLRPRLLLLDEPSLGLASSLVSKALEHVAMLSHEFGVASLIVEQKVREVLKVSTRVFVLRQGTVSFSGKSELLQDDAKLRQFYL